MLEPLTELDGHLLTVPKHGTVQRDGIPFLVQRYFYDHGPSSVWPSTRPTPTRG